MSDKHLLLPHEQATERILAAFSPSAPEWVPVSGALGRALSDDVVARRTLPPWDNSAMDGYAVRAEDLSTPKARLRVAEAIFAGMRSERPLERGECARIMTGAPLPPGANAVVMQERARAFPGEGLGEVELDGPISPGAFVRASGEEAKAGHPLLAAGTPIGIPEAALLWGQGIERVRVPRRPRVAILSTGDELCRIDDATEGRIPDLNGPLLAVAVERAGGLPVALGVARDDPAEVKALLAEAFGCDLVLSSAGVSVGERDFVRPALEELGAEIDFFGVAIKPGKPLVFGRRGATPFFGLPGNPTSSLVTFELFVRPALSKMLGHLSPRPRRVEGTLEGALSKSAGIAHFVRVQAEWRDGGLFARPLATQTSGVVRSAASATHLLHFPREATRLEKGARVELWEVSWT